VVSVPLTQYRLRSVDPTVHQGEAGVVGVGLEVGVVVVGAVLVAVELEVGVVVVGVVLAGVIGAAVPVVGDGGSTTTTSTKKFTVVVAVGKAFG
jgi:hypothetical protein